MISVTRGSVDLIAPSDMPEGEVWRYGIGVPFQVAPGKAALSCNIRKEYAPVVDFEVGADMIIFDDLSNISADGAIPINRSEEELDPTTGEPCIMMKYPVIGGFVPFGAKRADGSAHPHAGTGFGVSQVVPFMIETQKTAGGTFNEIFQFAYDDDGFRVVKVERVPNSHIPGMSNAIPDGDDLLFAMWDHPMGAGVSRWSREDGDWRLVSYSRVEGARASAEPSLIRDVDGALLFCTRKGYDIRVWRSYDVTTWELIATAEHVRSESPLTLNQAADGTPYVAANIHQETFTDTRGYMVLGRETLSLWPLNAERTAIEPAIVARQSRGEFGAPPGRTYWCVDHPSASTVQLADGKWHNVLAYRVLEEVETCPWCRLTGVETYSAHTGCFVEEVLSDGEARPSWSF